MKKFTIALTATAAAMALAACSQEADDTTPAATETAMADAGTTTDAGTIVEVAQGNNDFSTLVSAVTAAGLGETLSGTGPYTVFAPTNAAFEKIPQATRDELMSEAGKEDLTGILTYHVVEGNTDAATLTKAIKDAGADGYTLITVNGATLTAMMDGDNVVLRDAAGNTATVTATDVAASNGVIHVIDTVLMPS